MNVCCVSYRSSYCEICKSAQSIKIRRFRYSIFKRKVFQSFNKDWRSLSLAILRFNMSKCYALLPLNWSVIAVKENGFRLHTKRYSKGYRSVKSIKLILHYDFSYLRLEIDTEGLACNSLIVHGYHLKRVKTLSSSLNSKICKVDRSKDVSDLPSIFKHNGAHVLQSEVFKRACN